MERGTDQQRTFEATQVEKAEVPELSTGCAEEAGGVEMVRLGDFDLGAAEGFQQGGQFALEGSVEGEILWGLGTGRFKLLMEQLKGFVHWLNYSRFGVDCQVRESQGFHGMAFNPLILANFLDISSRAFAMDIGFASLWGYG